jgi:acetyl esterase/lipase
VSTTTEVTQTILKLVKIKDFAVKQYENPPRGNGVMDAKHFKSGYTVETWEVMGKKVTTVRGTGHDGRHVVFFHGGSYVVEATPFHRRLIQVLVKKYHMTVSFVDYPLAPENTWKTTKDMVLQAYREITQKNPGDTFFLFGDSAGGGLALSLLQTLRNEGLPPFPMKTVLCSPWLDLSLQNKHIADYEEFDPVLSVKGLLYAASLYASQEDLSHPFLSPLFGNMENLGEILLYVGTHEIFFPDCLALQEKIESSEGSSVSLVLGEGLMHDWVLFPSKEAKEVPAQIDEFLR